MDHQLTVLSMEDKNATTVNGPNTQTTALSVTIVSVSLTGITNLAPSRLRLKVARWPILLGIAGEIPAPEIHVPLLV